MVVRRIYFYIYVYIIQAAFTAYETNPLIYNNTVHIHTHARARSVIYNSKAKVILYSCRIHTRATFVLRVNTLQRRTIIVDRCIIRFSCRKKILGKKKKPFARLSLCGRYLVQHVYCGSGCAALPTYNLHASTCIYNKHRPSYIMF